MKTLRVGVIGLGMGRGHVEQFHSHPNATVVALADLDKSRLKEVGEQHGITTRYTAAEEMIRKEGLDIVAVATPNKFHAPLTIAALKAGSHVLCEKPMAMTAAEAARMNRTARKVGKRIMINFSFRFNPLSRSMKQEVENGALGDIYYARTVWMRRLGMPGFGGWFGQKALSGGGPLIDLGVHRTDLALWLMGYPKPVWVMAGTYDHLARAKAKKARKKFDVEDLAVAMVRFDNGAMLEIEASWASHIKERELMETRLLGTKAGMVQRNLDEGYGFEAEFFLERDGRLYDMKLHEPMPHVASPMHQFVDCILKNKPHPATGEEGHTVMLLLDAIYKSAETKAPVKLA